MTYVMSAGLTEDQWIALMLPALLMGMAKKRGDSSNSNYGKKRAEENAHQKAFVAQKH